MPIAVIMVKRERFSVMDAIFAMFGFSKDVCRCNLPKIGSKTLTNNRKACQRSRSLCAERFFVARLLFVYQIISLSKGIGDSCRFVRMAEAEKDRLVQYYVTTRIFGLLSSDKVMFLR
jgi:hypothetical protein